MLKLKKNKLLKFSEKKEAFCIYNTVIDLI